MEEALSDLHAAEAHYHRDCKRVFSATEKFKHDTQLALEHLVTPSANKSCIWHPRVTISGLPN